MTGVSTAAPYKHFNDRNDIVRGAVLIAMERVKSAMQVAADTYPPRDPRQITALDQSYVDFAKAEPRMFRMMFGITEGHAQDAELARLGDETMAVIERVAAEHMGVPFDHPQAKLRASAMWCFVQGHSFQMLDSKLPEGTAAMAEPALIALIGHAMLPVVPD